jgi:hypothetical protein
MNRLACLLSLLLVSAVSAASCGGSKTGSDAAADGAGGAAGSSGSAGASGGGGGGGGGGNQGGNGGGGGGAGGNSCRTAGQSCSDTDRCCIPLICAGGCTMAPSDRNLKRDFAPVDGDQILDSLAALPITTWRYKTESGEVRHIGPMAQDFKVQFGVGTDDKHIFQVDGDGIALAAIKTLSERVNRLARENAELRREISRLRKPTANAPAPR